MNWRLALPLSALWALCLPGEAAADPIITPIIATYVTGSFVVAGVTITYAAVISAVITTAISVGLMYALAPRPAKMPEPSDGTVQVQQAIPPIIYAIGRCRIAGGLMVKESVGNALIQVAAIKDGPCVEMERFWFNDDEVTFGNFGGDARQLYPLDVVADHRYWNGNAEATPTGNQSLIRCWLHSGGSLPAGGAPGDNPAAWMIEAFPEVFTDDFRPDKTVAVGWASYNIRAKDQQAAFPNGGPTFSTAGRWEAVWDPRDVSQDPADPTTWQFSANPALIRIWYECWCPHGPLRDYREAVLPVVGRWIEEADACDDLIPQKAGGTAPRYQMGMWWEATTERAAVRATIQGACDGWDCEFGDGSFLMVVGKYRAPTVTLTDDDICGYSLDDDENDSEYINNLSIQYTSPDHAYGAVSTDPWRDEASIVEYGEKSDSVDLWQVQNLSQARRLGKRVVDRTHARIRGSLTTTLASLRILGERWVRVQSARVAKLSDVVVEVHGQKTSLMDMRRVVEIRSVNPNTIEAWDPEWEGQAPPAPTRIDGPGAPQMTGLSAVAEAIEIGPSVPGIAVDLRWDDFDGSSAYSFEERHRVGSDPWSSTDLASVTMGGGMIEARVMPVAIGATYEFQVRVPGGLWSASATVSTAADGIAPDTPDDLAATPGDGSVAITWRNPTTSNFDAVTVHRAAHGDGFGASVVVASGLTGGLGAAGIYTDVGLLPGAYDYWVTAENSAGTASTPAGPATASVIDPGSPIRVTSTGAVRITSSGSERVS